MIVSRVPIGPGFFVNYIWGSVAPRLINAGFYPALMDVSLSREINPISNYNQRNLQGFHLSAMGNALALNPCAWFYFFNASLPNLMSSLALIKPTVPKTGLPFESKIIKVG